jgi:hypothetical protein
MDPLIGIVLGLVVAAALVYGVHRMRTRQRPGPHPEGPQGAHGVPPDPGASRPAGPGAEAQRPDAGGGAHGREGEAPSR